MLWRIFSNYVSKVSQTDSFHFFLDCNAESLEMSQNVLNQVGICGLTLLGDIDVDKSSEILKTVVSTDILGFVCFVRA